MNNSSLAHEFLHPLLAWLLLFPPSFATFSLTDLRCAPTRGKKKMFFFPFSFCPLQGTTSPPFSPFGRYCKGGKKKSFSSRIILRVIQSSQSKRGATASFHLRKNSSAGNLCSLWSPARTCNVRTDDKLFSPFPSVRSVSSELLEIHHFSPIISKVMFSILNSDKILRIMAYLKSW